MNYHIKRFVEQEIKDYHVTVKMLAEATQELEKDVIYARPEQDLSGIPSSCLGCPTEKKAFALAALRPTRWIKEAEKRVQAIDRALAQLSEEQKHLLKIKYWTNPQTLTFTGIAAKMNVSEPTARRWNKHILTLVAREMGLI